MCQWKVDNVKGAIYFPTHNLMLYGHMQSKEIGNMLIAIVQMLQKNNMWRRTLKLLAYAKTQDMNMLKERHITK